MLNARWIRSKPRAHGFRERTMPIFNRAPIRLNTKRRRCRQRSIAMPWLYNPYGSLLQVTFAAWVQSAIDLTR